MIGGRALLGRLHPMLHPRAFPGKLAVERLPLVGLRFGIEQRIGGARHNGNLGMAGQFHPAQGLRGHPVGPAVAADRGDAQHLDIGGIQHHHLHQAKAIIIDDDLACAGAGNRLGAPGA